MDDERVDHDKPPWQLPAKPMGWQPNTLQVDIVAAVHAADYIAPMQRLQAFKFALLPDGGPQRQMRRFAGSCRFVYNQALALQKANFAAGG